MANRKTKPIQGEVCWFCKQPADHESWMGLGFLKSTTQPMFEGNYILYHEPCAVYSNGAGDLPSEGMDDESVLKFWLHGERCSGIGLKCQLCGLKGATTGCLHGPCQQFYHYPCARVRAAQGHLQFSLQCRSLACQEHLAMLPQPAEEQFLGMWMEGGGSWNGCLVQQAAATWLPHYDTYMHAFQARWHHLLHMVPVEALKAQQAKSRKQRKSSRGGRGSNSGDSDPEFRVKNPRNRSRQQQTAAEGGVGPPGKRQQLQQTEQQQQQQQQLQPTGLQVDQQGTGFGAACAAGPARDSFAGALMADSLAGHAEQLPRILAGQQQQQQQQQELVQGNPHSRFQPPALDCELLLQAAGFTSPLRSSQLHTTSVKMEHDVSSVPPASELIAAAAAAAAAVAAATGVNGTGSRTASGAAAKDANDGVSSADSAPATSGRHTAARAAAAAAAAGAAADATAAVGGDVISPGLHSNREAESAGAVLLEALAQQQQQQQLSTGGSLSAGLGGYPLRLAAPAALAMSADAAMPGGVLPAESSEGGMSYSTGMFQGPAGIMDMQQQQQQQRGRGIRRKYLDVNVYQIEGRKVLSHDAAPTQQQQQTVASAAAAAAGDGQQQQQQGQRGRAQKSKSGMQQPDGPSTSNLSRGTYGNAAAAAAAAAGGARSPTGLPFPSGIGLLGGNSSSTPAAPGLEGWPSSRGTDMFSWLQQQVQQQQQQQQQGGLGQPQTEAGKPLGGSSPAGSNWPVDLSLAGFQQPGREAGGLMGGPSSSAGVGGGSDVAGALSAALRAVAVAGGAAAQDPGQQQGLAKAPSDPAVAAAAAAAAAAGLAGADTKQVLDALMRAAQTVTQSAAQRSSQQQQQQHGQFLTARESSTQVQPLLGANCSSLPSSSLQQQGSLPRSPLSSLVHSPALLGASAAGSAIPGSPVQQQIQQLSQLLQQQQQQHRGQGDASSNTAGLRELAELLRQGAECIAAQSGAGAGPVQQQQQQPAALAGGQGSSASVIEAALAAATAALGKGSNNNNAAAAAAGGSSIAGPVLPVINEYFGCVTCLPPLQPGELRAAGVTAHPGVVAAYVKQDLKTALTLQPWSIVVPPAAIRQLTACNVPPSQLASQLYSLLHASNVLNNHATNGVAGSNGAAAHGSNGGAAAAGGSGALSGGYAGMPQDLPVRYVRGCLVPDHDPRLGLRGEFTLTALQDLEPGTVLGPWRSYAMCQAEYTGLMHAVPQGWQAPPGLPRQQAWMELLHKYTIAVKVPALQGDDPFGSLLAGNAPVLYFCALGNGNLTCLANDPVLDPVAAAQTTECERTKPPNVDICVVLVNGLPLPLLITIRPIRSGEEVCYSYGKLYWQAWAGLRAAMVPAGSGWGRQ